MCGGRADCNLVWIVIAWPFVLAIALLGPALGPGYALSYDMVFTPREFLQPWMLGLEGGWPRSVPQDTVLSVLGYAIPGWALQKVALFAALVLAGAGCAGIAARAAPGAPRIAGVVAATFAIWNPFVVERLVIGHWSLLLAYAAAPWAIRAALDLRSGRGGAAPLVLWCALGALTPFGGVGVALIALPLLVGVRPGRCVPVLLGVVCVNLPWLVPTLGRIGSAGVPYDTGAGAFALRSEGPWGEFLTALGLGGIWNADAVPTSRGWWSAPVIALAVFAAGAAMVPALTQRLGRWPVAWWGGLSIAGLAVALIGAHGAVWQGIPGAVLLRDAQKALGPLALLLAVALGVLAARLARRSAERSTRAGIAALLVLVPIASMPDAFWGVSGRLSAVDYPGDWYAVREILNAPGSAPGDVVSLPWSTFRRYDFNDDRTLLDPAPRWFDRTVVTDTALLVRARDGSLVRVAGDDPVARDVDALMAAGAPLDSVRRLGIGWALWSVGQPGAPTWSTPAALPAGAEVVYRGRDLVLARLGGPTAARTAETSWPVYAANGLAGITVLGLLVSMAVRDIRARRRAGRVGLLRSA